MNYNNNSLPADETTDKYDVDRRIILRIINRAKHHSEIPAGMAYSSYEHRHEAPDRIGIFRSGKPIHIESKRLPTGTNY